MANALDLVGLSALMRLSAGRPEVVIGLIDGPVAIGSRGPGRECDPAASGQSERRLLESQ